MLMLMLMLMLIMLVFSLGWFCPWSQCCGFLMASLVQEDTGEAGVRRREQIIVYSFFREHDVLVIHHDGEVENVTKFPFGPEHNIV